MTSPRVAPSPDERAFQAQVIELAHLLRWRVAHFRPARTAHGWRTAVAADGAGFPDLVLVRERVLFAELKSERGHLTPDQRAWIDGLRDAGAEAHVWRPADFDQITATLTRRDPRPADRRWHCTPPTETR